MIDFKDGPAKGIEIKFSPYPEFLRVALNKKHKFRALNYSEDQPTEEEIIFVYNKTKFLSGVIDYSIFPFQPPDRILRNNSSFSLWCKFQLRLAALCISDSGIFQSLKIK